MFHIYNPGEPKAFLPYNGEIYINGTEIILSDEYIKTHTYQGKKLWKYAKFGHVTTYYGQTAYFFWSSRHNPLTCNMLGLDVNTLYDYACFFIVPVSELYDAVGEITRGFKLSKEETEMVYKAYEEMISKKDWDYPEMILAWIVYIVVLVGSLIFREYYLLWPIITYIFLKYRKGIMSGGH